MERGGLEKWKGWILRLARAQRKQLAGDVDTGRGSPEGGKEQLFLPRKSFRALPSGLGALSPL